MSSSDVVVVGAGIGGAVLALALGSRGWRVKLLEREARPGRIVRPEILWGATPAALDRFGLGDVIRTRASVQLGGVEFMRGARRLLGLSPADLGAAKVEAYSTDPGMTRQAIADAAAATGNVTVERGVEVRCLVRDGGRIVGALAVKGGTPSEERGRLVVGDDGAHSVVRAEVCADRGLAGRASGDAPGQQLDVFPVDFVTAAVSWLDALPVDRVRVWLNPTAFRAGIPAMGCFPWPGRRGVLLIPLPHARAAALEQGSAEAFWSELARLTPLAADFAAQLAFPGDFRRVKRPFGHAGRYVADGAALIGDAAHPMSPAGGQGANAAIWDALALAEVADEALAADDLGRRRLARYEALRRPRNGRSVRISERAARFFRYAGYVPGLPWLVPAVLKCIDRLPGLKSRFVSSIATTFVTQHDG